MSYLCRFHQLLILICFFFNSAGPLHHECTTTARQLLDDHQFKDDIGLLLTPNTINDGSVYQLRRRLLSRARESFVNANEDVPGTSSQGNNEEGTFPDSWLDVQNGHEFVDSYYIHLTHATMQDVSVMSLFTAGVVDETNRYDPLVRAFVRNLLRYHPGCPSCTGEVHKVMHEDGAMRDIGDEGEDAQGLGDGSSNDGSTDDSVERLV